MDSPLRIPPDELRGEAEKRKKRILNAPPLNKPLPKGYMLLSKISETLTLCVSAACRTTVCKRLSDFFVCTSRMSGIVCTILWIERSEKQKKLCFLAELFGVV